MERVVDVYTMEVNWDSTIIVKINYAKIPRHLAEKYSERVSANMKSLYPNNKILVIGSDTEVSISNHEPTTDDITLIGN